MNNNIGNFLSHYLNNDFDCKISLKIFLQM